MNAHWSDSIHVLPPPSSLTLEHSGFLLKTHLTDIGLVKSDCLFSEPQLIPNFEHYQILHLTYQTCTAHQMQPYTCDV